MGETLPTVNTMRTKTKNHSFYNMTNEQIKEKLHNDIIPRTYDMFKSLDVLIIEVDEKNPKRKNVEVRYTAYNPFFSGN